jgi:thiol-disulfide isomerase/thioredoxin
MLVYLIGSALAGSTPPPPAVADDGDAWYLQETGRSAPAATWFLAHLESAPDAKYLLWYLGATGALPDWRSIAVVSQVEQWGASHPGAQDLGAALAMAYGLSAMSAGDYSPGPFGEAGPWCDDALAAMAALPEAPLPRDRVLSTRVAVERACDRPTADDRAMEKELDQSGQAGVVLRAEAGFEDGVDADDLAALEATLDGEPWRLAWLGFYASSKGTGPSAEAARALVVERARALASEDRPSHLWAAMAVFEAGELTDELAAARAKLLKLDPGNFPNRWASQHRPPDDPDAPPEAATVLDPEARYAALSAEPVPERAQRVEYWAGLAHAAGAAGKPEERLAALDRLWRVDPSFQSNEEYAVAAAELDVHLRRAQRVATTAVDQARSPPSYRGKLNLHGRTWSWSGSLADALNARAAVEEARGKDARAMDDLEEALALVAATPERVVRLGLLYAAHDRDALARPMLASGLASLPADDPLVPVATTALSASLARGSGWMPDAATLIAASRPASTDAPAVALDGSRFVDLSLLIDGQQRALFDIPGPIVIDLWATWCGPCRQSLPHLDELARRYEGRVTFLAASVDAEQAKATSYLTARGDHAFEDAWLGRDGMGAVGVHAIPAMFVFDAQHRLVAQLAGWAPMDHSLDDAVASVLAAPPGLPGGP